VTILVTGGCGYIGSQICYRLADRRIPFVIVDDLSTGSLAAPPPGSVCYQSDFADETTLRRIFKEHQISTCIHLAALKSVAESIKQPALYYDQNLNKLTRLMQSFSTLGGKYFVFSSSAAVYGDTPALLVKEQDPCRPINPYGRSKLAGEFVVNDICEASGISCVIMRYFNVAGADLTARTGERSTRNANLFNVIIEAIGGNREYVPIYGTDYDTPDGTCVRDFIHVQDLADAHIAAVDFLKAGGRSVCVNCGYGQGYSVRTVIDAFSSLIGKRVPTRDFARRVGDPVQVVADPQVAKSLFNWQPTCADIHAIVQSELRWRSAYGLL
jgi:UDP-glucose 4-epimerase